MKKNIAISIVIFVVGITIIFSSTFLAGFFMETIFRDEANFLGSRFISFQVSFQIIGGLISLFGIVNYAIHLLRGRK